MNSPKEKAQELLDTMTKQTYKYKEYAYGDYITCEIGYEGGKKCALVAVDEIIEVFKKVHLSLNMLDFIKGDVTDTETYKYWQEVKQEIESL